MFRRVLVFTDRNKAKVIIRVTSITRCIAWNRFTNRNRFSEKSYKVISGIGNVITRCNNFKRNFRNTREGLSVKKVEEILETVLLILGVTRVLVIADFWVEISSDLLWWGIIELTDCW